MGSSFAPTRNSQLAEEALLPGLGRKGTWIQVALGVLIQVVGIVLVFSA